MKHRSRACGDHTSASREEQPDQQNRTVQPDRIITLEDIKGGPKLELIDWVLVLTMGIITTGAAINQISVETLRSANKRATVLFDQCYKYETLILNCNQYIYCRTDEMNRLLWTALLYYDMLQQHKEARTNDHLSLPG